MRTPRREHIIDHAEPITNPVRYSLIRLPDDNHHHYGHHDRSNIIDYNKIKCTGQGSSICALSAWRNNIVTSPSRTSQCDTAHRHSRVVNAEDSNWTKTPAK